MRLKNHITILFLALGLMASCQDNQEEVATLAISPEDYENVHLPPEASQKTFIIEASTQKWSAMSNSEWVKVEAKGKELLLSIDENFDYKQRYAQVIVIGAGKQLTIGLRQDASEHVFGSDLHDIEIDQFGGQQILDVTTHVKNWEVSTQADWFTVKAIPYLDKIEINIKENTEVQPRKGSFTISGEGKSKTINILQNAAQEYILPFFEWGKNFDDVSVLESSRRSELQMIPNPSDPSASYYRFGTKSEKFPYIDYETMNSSDKFIYRITLGAKNSDVLESQEFMDFFTQQGYEKELGGQISISYNHVYRNDKLKNRAIITVGNNTATITFVPIIEQDQDFPSLSSLYYGYLDFGVGTPKDLKAHEKNEGGYYDAYKSAVQSRKSKLKMEIYHGASPFFARSYIFDPNSEKLMQTQYIFDTLNIGLFEYGGLTFLTREFHELLTKEGFVITSYDSKSYIYTNTEKNLQIGIRMVTWNEKHVLSYNLFPIPTK